MNLLLSWYRSLAVRLVLAVLAVECTLVLGGLFIYAAVLPFAGAGIDLGAAVAPVTQSVARDAAGRLVLRPNAALRELLAHNPTLRIAVFERDSGMVAGGSDTGLAAVLNVAHRARILNSALDSEDVVSAAGPVTMLMTADRGSIRNVWAGAMYFGGSSLKWLLPAALVLGAIAVLVVWLSLRPVRRAAAALRELNVRNLGTTIPERRIPREVLPFVRAINSVLERLEADVARQRRFIASAAHELRTPVAVQKARIDAMPPGPLRDELAGDTARIATLVEQLLAMARLGDYRLPLDQDVDIAEVARRLVADMAPLAIAQDRNFSLCAHGATATVRGNRQAIEVALTNVLDNALKVEPEGGTVEVSTGPGPIVIVSDHGPGLTDEERSRIFEPFWRKSPGSRGTGLGLSIVRECVRLHSGEVRVESWPGKGTTFTLLFRDAAVRELVMPA